MVVRNLDFHLDKVAQVNAGHIVENPDAGGPVARIVQPHRPIAGRGELPHCRIRGAAAEEKTKDIVRLGGKFNRVVA